MSVVYDCDIRFQLSEVDCYLSSDLGIINDGALLVVTEGQVVGEDRLNLVANIGLRLERGDRSTAGATIRGRANSNHVVAYTLEL